jgi:hypothetical protein
MPLKDHYRTLGIPARATMHEVKKAYRALAHKYHPDKNPDNALAAQHFREIQEAYTILHDEKRRKLYDEERYFAGLSAQKEPAHISGEWILQQARKLKAHMAQVDSYRMNHGALHDYVHLLLSDSHLAVLQAETGYQVKRQIVAELLDSLRYIHFRLMRPLSERLLLLAEDDQELKALIVSSLAQSKRAASVERYLPLIVVVVTLALCVIMYLYSRNVL